MASRAGLNLNINAGVRHHALLYFERKCLIVFAVKINDWVVLVGRVCKRCHLRDGWLTSQLGDPMILILLGEIVIETAMSLFHDASSVILSKRNEDQYQQSHKSRQARSDGGERSISQRVE